MHYLTRKRARDFVDKSIQAWHNHPETQQQENITIDDAKAVQSVMKSMEELNGCTFLLSVLRDRVRSIRKELDFEKDPAKVESLYHEKLVLEKRIITLT